MEATPDILTMPAGRPLDRALAQLAGWLVGEEGSVDEYKYFSKDGIRIGDVLPYSTQKEASEQLAGDAPITIRPDGERWFGVVWGHPNVYAETEPLARCRAWATWTMGQQGA